MADTIRKQVLDALQSQVDAAVTATVRANLNRALSIAELPAVVMVDGGHDVAETFTNTASVTMRVELELYAVGSDLRAGLDALYRAVMAALLADRTLGGLAIDTREVGLGDPVTDQEGASPAIIAAPLQIEVEFETAAGDRTAAN